MPTRIIKILLALSAASWGLIGAIRNLVDYEATIGFTAFLLPVEGTESLRAIDNPVFTHLSYAFVWGSKLVTTALCGYGAYELWLARRDSVAEFSRAKEKVYLGIGIALFMLFFGFMVVLGGVFAP